LRCSAATVAAFYIVAAQVSAQQDAAVLHWINLTDARNQIVEIQTRIPTHSQDTVEIMMPVWAPGYYVIENFAEKVSDVSAKSEAGNSLPIDRTTNNRWTIAAKNTAEVCLTYRLKCDQFSVVNNWLGQDYAVLNGPATFFCPLGSANRPQRVRLQLPDNWKAFSGLTAAGDSADEFSAPDYDTLIDSPILAGKNLSVNEFDVAGTKHLFVGAGDHPGWDGEKAAATLKQLVQGMHVFWGRLPFDRYVFLNVFDKGGGGLEHLNSTLITTRLNPNAPQGEPWKSYRWLAFVSHEYFHSFNVKRLRPIELGPFDYERPPKTPSLWISEGLTSYYGDLMVTRSGLGQPSDFLAAMSSYIRQLQDTPGRLKQSLADASLDVWNGGTSGVNRDKENKISYYVKGPIVGFLLDAKIRKATGGANSLDDVMRLAYERYSGKQGFTPEQFVEASEQVAGVDLDAWFKLHLESTKELDYREALDWFGLKFADIPDPADARAQWTIVEQTDASEAQRAQFRHLTSGPQAAGAAK
jgi:predicted metalloprotease with PDZ domain